MNTFIWQIQQRRGMAWFPLNGANLYEVTDDETLSIELFADKLLGGTALDSNFMHRVLVWRGPRGERSAPDHTAYWPVGAYDPATGEVRL